MKHLMKLEYLPINTEYSFENPINGGGVMIQTFPL